MALMMKCGHASNAIRTATKGEKHEPPIPCCGICDCTEVDDAAPSLEGRQACCSHEYGPKGKHAIVASSSELAFFEYRGPGSREATQKCTCGYALVAHGKSGFRCKSGGFKAKGPQQYDHHYCGCHGWD